MKVMQFPLTGITLGFVFGILISYFEKPALQLVAVWLPAVACAAIVLTVAYGRRFFGIMMFAVSILIGSMTWSIHQESFRKNHYVHYCDDSGSHNAIISLTEKLKSTAYKNRYIASVKKIDGKTATGKILVSIEKSAKSEFIVGTRLMATGLILKNRPPNNPDQFDYGKYLSNKSIPAQMFVSLDAIKVNAEPDNSIWYFAAKIRERVLRNLKENHFRNEELNIVLALILGQQQDIDPEILHDYQFAGAVHVLSVSGLHIGFVLLFLNFILSGMPKNNTGRILRFFIILISLWGFAIIAGMSPSVVRSVTMFSFVAAGLCLKRETNIFHTLLVSILLILLFAPSFLFDVGFQLSYVSLFFILWLQPLFSKIWQPRNKICVYFWNILTVSFAAQIGAFPLSIFYFHQFPGLFFITNLIILPCLGIIMAIGVCVVIMAAFNYVPVWPAVVLEWSIHLLNVIINKIASFEQFVIQDISFNTYMLFSVYLLIIGLGIWLKKSTYANCLAALSALMIFQVIFITTKWQSQTKEELVVFHSLKNTMVSEKKSGKVVVYTSSPLGKIQENKILKSYLTAGFCGIFKKKKPGNTLYFHNKKIFIIDSNAVYQKDFHPDILLITQSPKINLDRLLQQSHPEIIIADGSNYSSYVKLWDATCRKAKIPFHATAEKGCYRLE